MKRPRGMISFCPTLASPGLAVVARTAGVVLVAVAVVLISASSVDARSRMLRLLAIGDSIPYGRSDCGYCPTFVDLFGNALARATGARVVVRNLSEHTGIGSSDLRSEITASKTFRAAVAGADAITVSVGHNDPPWNNSHDPCDGPEGYPDADWTTYDAACLRASAAMYRSNLEAILRTVRSLRARRPTLLRVTDDYDDLIGDPQVPVAAYPIAKQFFDTYSGLTCRVARVYKAVCIETYHAFNGSDGTRDAGPFLALDHTHPNPSGHRLIASLLVRAGFAPLR